MGIEENIAAYEEVKASLVEVAKPDCLFVKLLAGVERDKGLAAAIHLLERTDGALQGKKPLKLHGYERRIFINECISPEELEKRHTLTRRGFYASCLALLAGTSAMENCLNFEGRMHHHIRQGQNKIASYATTRMEDPQTIEQETKKIRNECYDDILLDGAYVFAAEGVSLLSIAYLCGNGRILREQYNNFLSQYMVQADQLLHLSYAHLAEKEAQPAFCP